MSPLLLFVLALGVLLLIGVGVVMVGLRQMKNDQAMSDRLVQFTDTGKSLEEMELELPLMQRVILPFTQGVLDLLSKYGPKQSRERLLRNLQQAGNPGNLTPARFVGLRVALSLLLVIIFGIATASSGMEVAVAMMYTSIGLLLGYMMPVMWLGRKIKGRKKAIQRALPDAIDLLTISVEAGLGFDTALQRVSMKWDDELGREFKRVLSDIRLGMPRRDAMRDMANRTGVEDIQTFVAAVIQADQLGVPMTKILRIQSEQMRMRRRQRAEELAQQAPIKMMFPMVFLIFPAIFVVILGPAVPRLVGKDGLGGM